MITAICTLFEGHYHFGVATLSNSLYKNGFRGTIYIGYRGSLPSWASKGQKQTVGIWNDAIVLNPAEGMQLVFLPLTTTYSLTNYKPDFMLELWDGPAEKAEALFYFDPDIVVDQSWTYFEEWVDSGVALCEDINSPFQEFHPRRVGWRKYFRQYNLELHFKNATYVNGGFIGLLKKDLHFLKLWKKVQENMGEAIGGLKNSIFSNHSHSTTIAIVPGFQIFDKSDQDALNCTIECFDGQISYLGKEGMGFIIGESLMFHALGSLKPWKINHLSRSLSGRIPRREDVIYWDNTVYPISAHSSMEIKKKKLAIQFSKLIGRFYNV